MGVINTLARIVGFRGNTHQSISAPRKSEHINKKSYPAAYSIMRPRFGFRDDVGIEFRSKMEANVYRFYKYLEKERGRIKVEYEPKLFTFPSGGDNRFNINGYIPDLEITSDHGVLYIEVKGSLSDKDREKTRLISKYHPGIKIFFVFPEQYRDIQKCYAKYIPNWEY